MVQNLNFKPLSRYFIDKSSFIMIFYVIYVFYPKVIWLFSCKVR